MKTKYLKACVLVIIILFLGSPIISSTSTITISKQRIPIETIEPLTIQKDLDPKIVEAIQKVNESLLREFLTVLSVEIGPRKTGTYGCEEAAKYIFKQFKKMGLETEYHEWSSWTPYKRKKRFFRSENVIATLLGNGDLSDEILILNAHYDTTKYSPGAIDDGSGVAAVLATAYALGQYEFNRTIKFVAFSGEEIGLLGSRAYARELYKNDADILVQFNADMVGYANTSDEGRIAYLSSTNDAKWICDEINSVNEDYGIGFNVKRGWNISEDRKRGGSDYYDFVLHGYEAVAFWESGQYRYAHTPYDNISKVNFSYLTNMTKLIVASLAHMADIEVYYPHVKIGAPRRGRLYFEDVTLIKFRYERTVVIDDVLICAKVKPGNAPIEKVEFYYDNELVYTDTESPYQWRLNELSIKKHTAKVILYDELGRNASDKVTFRYINLNTKK